MTQKTGLFLAGSTPASVSSALRPHRGLIHILPIQVLISLQIESNEKPAIYEDDRSFIGAGNRT